MRRDTLLALGLVLFLLAALAPKSLLVSMPPARDEPGQFDANRAKARLASLLGDQGPHPVDSPADDRVRARLVATSSKWASNRSFATRRSAMTSRKPGSSPAPASGTSSRCWDRLMARRCCSARITTAFPWGRAPRTTGSGSQPCSRSARSSRKGRSDARSSFCSTKARRWACSAPAPSCRSAQPQRRQPAQLRGARRQRARHHVRNEPAEWSCDPGLRSFRSKALRKQPVHGRRRLIPNDTDVRRSRSAAG